MGHWVSALQVIAKEIEQVVESPLPNNFLSRLSGIVSIANKNEIVNLRYEKRGHGYCDSHDAGYSKVFQEYGSVINSIENYLMPILKRLKCYYVISIDRTTSGQFEIEALKLMGDHPDFEEEVIPFYHKD